MRDCLVDIAALAQVDLTDSPEAYNEAMRTAYWEDKDLAGAIAIAFAGISRLLAEARHGSPEHARVRRSQAKALTYDLASFTWPGWDEPGIVITPPEMRAGHAAARANLAMAEELEKGDLPLSRAYWMLGAHELAASLFAEARTAFEAAATHADQAGTEGRSQAALARAFALVAALAEGLGDGSELQAAIALLEAAEDGPAYAEQVRTARSVFGI